MDTYLGGVDNRIEFIDKLRIPSFGSVASNDVDAGPYWWILNYLPIVTRPNCALTYRNGVVEWTCRRRTCRLLHLR